MKLSTALTVLAAVASTAAALPVANHAAHNERQAAYTAVLSCVIDTSNAQHDFLGVYVRSQPCTSAPAIDALYDTNSVVYLGQYHSDNCDTGSQFMYAKVQMMGPQGKWIVGWIDASAMDCSGNTGGINPPPPPPPPAVTPAETPAQAPTVATANDGPGTGTNTAPAQVVGKVTSAAVEGAFGG